MKFSPATLWSPNEMVSFITRKARGTHFHQSSDAEALFTTRLDCVYPWRLFISSAAVRVAAFLPFRGWTFWQLTLDADEVQSALRGNSPRQQGLAAAGRPVQQRPCGEPGRRGLEQSSVLDG